ncbi:MAG: DUF5779 family protein [Halobacteriales archaeon]
MSDFEIDLQAVEEHLDDAEDGDGGGGGQVVLGVLDGTTPSSEWADAVRDGYVLVLAIEGDLNRLAAGFAADVSEEGGDLVQFRDFLVVTPAGVEIDRSRLE